MKQEHFRACFKEKQDLNICNSNGTPALKISWLKQIFFKIKLNKNSFRHGVTFKVAHFNLLPFWKFDRSNNLCLYIPELRWIQPTHKRNKYFVDIWNLWIIACWKLLVYHVKPWSWCIAQQYLLIKSRKLMLIMSSFVF